MDGKTCFSKLERMDTNDVRTEVPSLYSSTQSLQEVGVVVGVF